MSRILVLAAAVAALAVPATALAAGAGGVTGPAIYVDGALYRTVGTPTDLSGTGGPASSFDTIYDFGGVQQSVATAGPGDPDFNGGRWHVHAISVADYGAALDAGDLNGNGVLDSDVEVLAAIDAGAATDLGVVKSFECPVIPLSQGV